MNQIENIRLTDYSDMVSTLPSPLALALRSDHMCAFALEMFIEDDDNIPGNPFRGINHQAKCMPVLLCCRGVLVALHRIVSNSGKFFYESCLWGGILLCASQLLLKAKSQPWFTLASLFSWLLFSGCGGKITQIVSVPCWVWACKWHRAKLATLSAAFM